MPQTNDPEIIGEYFGAKYVEQHQYYPNIGPSTGLTTTATPSCPSRRSLTTPSTTTTTSSMTTPSWSWSSQSPSLHLSLPPVCPLTHQRTSLESWPLCQAGAPSSPGVTSPQSSTASTSPSPPTPPASRLTATGPSET